MAPTEEQITAAFKVFDVNNDGTISKDELYAVLKRPVQGQQLNDDQIEQLFFKLDTSGDGKIDIKEFASAYSSDGKINGVSYEAGGSAGKMDVSDKGLAALPDIAAGTTSIDASDNTLVELPESIAVACKDSLEELLLFKNKIKTIHPTLGDLQSLVTLNLFNNQIAKVRVGIEHR